jgi:hypothetical protein
MPGKTNPLRRHPVLLTLGIIVLLLVILRAALPSIVKDQVNQHLAALEDYDGRIVDVDIALWRGAYRVDGIEIVKTGSRQPTPFFSADHVDFSIEWRSLLRGRLVGESAFTRPNLNLVRAEDKKQSELGQEADWADTLEALTPFRLNTVKIENGTVSFRAPGISSKDALTATRLFGQISNITNVVESGEETFAHFQAQASVLKSGWANVTGRANPLAEQPTFDVNLTVKNVNLPEVNPWLREYIKADAEAGEFELYTELAAAEGKFEGYAKPIMRKVDIYSSEEEEDNPFRRLWEGLVDFAAEIVEEDDTGQVAARIPFSGTVKNPDADTFETIVSVLHNAFVSAFSRSLEGSVSLRDVKKRLKKVGKDREKSKRDD